jgi:hypothetical protein
MFVEGDDAEGKADSRKRLVQLGLPTRLREGFAWRWRLVHPRAPRSGSGAAPATCCALVSWPKPCRDWRLRRKNSQVRKCARVSARPQPLAKLRRWLAWRWHTHPWRGVGRVRQDQARSWTILALVGRADSACRTNRTRFWPASALVAVWEDSS